MRYTYPLTLLIAAALSMEAPVAAQHRLRPRDSDSRDFGSGYQGRNDRTERFSRKLRLARDGRVSVSNIAGEIVVTAGSGDEVTIDGMKRARGDGGDLGSVQIEVEERGGSVFIRTNHTRGNDRVSVDYTISMPAQGAADLHSVSGDVKVTGIRGTVRAESVSGNINASDTPKLEVAKSVSGTVTLSGVSTGGDLSAASVSGDIVAKGVKVHALDVSSVSGEVTLTDVTCDRLGAKSVSGNIEYEGGISRGGSYAMNVHSGNVRLTLINPAGFVLDASTFSGSLRSELPMTIGGDSGDSRDGRRRRGGFGSRTIRATYGDGSATISARSFSGDVVIAKR